MSAVPEYDVTKSYSQGDRVILNGTIYEAKWWAGEGSSPDAPVSGAWETPWKIVEGAAPTPTDVAPVTPTDPVKSQQPTETPVETESSLPDTPTSVDVTYGAIWGTNPTSSVQFLLSEDLAEMTMLLPLGTIHDITGPWGATVDRSTYNNMDKLVFRKLPTITYLVTTFGFNLALKAGKSFDTIQVNECILNDRQCDVNFKESSTAASTPSEEDAVDPFPKKVLDDSGKFVRNNIWTPTGTTYQTFKSPTYSTTTGQRDYMVGGYFTDWGIYSGFTPARLPINDINFIQLAFAGICGPGDETNWYGNESATTEAKPKIIELCKGKPVGTLIILDHWAHYGKKDMNLPEWIKPYAELAYHVDGYERGLNFLGFGYPDEYPIHNVGGVVLSGEGKLNYAYGIQNDLRSYNQALNRNGRKFNMFLSIGGWTLSDPFPAIAASPTFRKTFIDSVISYLDINKHINGVDIDWEFIGVDGAKSGIMGARDSNNYTLLMSELRMALTKLGEKNTMYYHLSAAIGTAPKHLDKINWNPVTIGGQNYAGMKNILDHVFLMSYDYYGPWGTAVGHQTPLFQNGEFTGYSCNSAVQYLKGIGVSSRKIILGVAAYGRIWKNVSESDLNRSGKYTYPNQATGQSPGNVGSQAAVVYWHHLKRSAYDGNGNLKDGYRWIKDEKAKAEFLIYEDNDSNTNFVTTVDTPYSVTEKAKYVKEQNLGGIFYWSLDNDNGDLLNAIHNGLGSERLSDDLEPSFRENSMLLYRVKEANYASNANIKQKYAMVKINDVIGNVFTFGGKGIVDSLRALFALPQALAENKSVKDLSEEEWEEYLQLIKSVDKYGDTVANLTIDEARATAENAGATLGFTTVDILFSPPFLLGIGLTAGLQDVILDHISSHEGGDYTGPITRGTLDPWQKMREDIPAMTYNY